MPDNEPTPSGREAEGPYVPRPLSEIKAIGDAGWVAPDAIRKAGSDLKVDPAAEFVLMPTQECSVRVEKAAGGYLVNRMYRRDHQPEPVGGGTGWLAAHDITPPLPGQPDGPEQQQQPAAETTDTNTAPEGE